MLDELWSWIQTLEPPFLFLLILPFVVGVAGLLGELARKHLRNAPVARRKGN